MYDYIQGKVVLRNPSHTVIETSGIGYELVTHINTYSSLDGQPEARLYIHSHYVNGPAGFQHTLYGFTDTNERDFFRLLISVSGLGPTSALLMLSAMTVPEIQAAILAENSVLLTKIKGIGPKTAKRVILDLKEKVAKINDGVALEVDLTQVNSSSDEALSALMALGFNRSAAQKALQKAQLESDNKSVESLIKGALRWLT